MVIDFHTHTFPDKIAAATIELLKQKSRTENFSDGTTHGLSEQLKKNGIDLAVVLPVVTNPLKTAKINDAAALLNEHTAQTRVFSFGGIHPDTPDYKSELKRIAALGLKGIKLHPAYQQVNLDDIRYERIVGYADELGLIVSVHGGVDIGIAGDWSTPARARKLLDDVKPHKLVMAHMGGWLLWEDVKKYLCGQDVYLDTSFSCGSFGYRDDVPPAERMQPLSEEEFTNIIRLHGADKVLFGTDSPWSDHAEQLALIRRQPLSDEEKSKILGENAKKLLQL